MKHSVLQIQSAKGVSIGEYVMIGALVALVSIGALSALGGGFGNALSWLQGDMQGAVASASGGGSGGAGGNGGGGGANGRGRVGIGNQIPPPGPNQKQVCLSSGICVNFPVASKFGVDIAGGEGADFIRAWSAALRSLANQLEAENPNDPIIAKIRALANQGNSLGAVVGQLDRLCGASSDCGGSAQKLQADRYMMERIDRQNEFRQIWGTDASYTGEPGLNAMLQASPKPIYNDIYNVINTAQFDIVTTAGSYAGSEYHFDEAGSLVVTNNTFNADARSSLIYNRAATIRGTAEPGAAP